MRRTVAFHTFCRIALLVPVLALAAAADKEASEAMAKDARLDKAVSIAAPSDSLEEITARLSQETGVTLYVRESVRDDKVAVFCAERSARDVMAAVADVWDYEWRLVEREEDPQPRYSLVRPAATQIKQERRVEEMGKELDDQLRQEINRRYAFVEGGLDKFRRFLEMARRSERDWDAPASERAERERKNKETMREAYREVYAGDLAMGPTYYAAEDFARDTEFQEPRAILGRQALLYSLVWQGPNALAALLSGKTVDIAVPTRPDCLPVPIEAQDALLEEYGKRHPHVFTDEEIEDIVQSQDDPTVQESARRYMAEEKARAEREAALPPVPVVVRFQVTWDVPETKQLIALVRRGDSPFASRVVIASAHPGVQPPARPDLSIVSRIPEDLRDLPVKLTVPTADQRPTRRLLLFPDAVEQIHVQTGADIIAQSFLPDATMAGSAGRLGEVVVNLAFAADYSADWRDDWLVFEHNRSYLLRLLEPPNRLLRKWQASEEKYGCVTLEDLVEIGSLHPWPRGRLTNRGAASEVPLYSISEMGLHYEMLPLLAFAASLLPEHRKAYINGEQLWIDQLSEEEQWAFADAFGDRLEHLTRDVPPGARFYAVVRDGGPVYAALRDPKTDRTRIEATYSSWFDQTQEQITESVRKEYEEQGYVVERVWFDPAPSQYTVGAGCGAQGVASSTYGTLRLRRTKDATSVEQRE